MNFDPEQLRQAMPFADTGDLLDRVTAYRQGMLPEAVEIVEDELDRRGVTRARILDLQAYWRRVGILHDDGTVVMCQQCRRPAIWQGTTWLRMLGGLVPIVPRTGRACRDHAPPAEVAEVEPEPT